MATVFLSHANRDDALAAQLESWLGTNGFSDTFVDHSAIRGGDKWADALRRAKASCRVVLCLVTPSWLDSDECFGEFTAAWYQGKRIVPLLAGPPADERQKKRLARVLAEDQGFDIAPALATGGLSLDDHPAIAEPFKAGLRAGGALMKVGLDPEAFEIDRARRPEPFPGLESFGDDDADAAIFYGRSPEIAELMETLRAMRATGELKPLVVLGASGSGKSSLMKAGLLPRLRRERAWLVLRSFRPGGDALLNFADAIARTAADLGVGVAAGAVRDALLTARASGDPARLRFVLDDIVKPLRERADRPDATLLIPLDQGEELSRAQGDSADALGDVLRAALANVTNSSATADADATTAAYAVTVTVRTDTFAELQLSPRFAGLDARCADIRPLPIYRFDNAVEGPAGRYGVEIDPGVVEALMEDAPGADALPLLAFAMQRLWRQYQAQRRIRLENYQSVGKLSGLLEDAAERALRGYSPTEDRPLETRLPADRERLAQRTFVPALAQVSDQGAPIRRVADFGAFDEREREMIDQFDRWRLVVKRGQNEVEVAHEALFREWPRFRAWLEPEKARLDMLRSVEAAASAWARHGKQQSYLDHRGKRLRDARALLGVGDYATRIGVVQRDYLKAAGQSEVRRMAMLGGASAVALVGLLTAGAISDRSFSRGKFEQQAARLNGANDEAGAARLALAALGAPTDWIKPSGGKKEEDRIGSEVALHESGYVLPLVLNIGPAEEVNPSDKFKRVLILDNNDQFTLREMREGRLVRRFGLRQKGRDASPDPEMSSDALGRVVYWDPQGNAHLIDADSNKVIAALGLQSFARFQKSSSPYLLTGVAQQVPNPATERRWYLSTLRDVRSGAPIPGFINLAGIMLDGKPQGAADRRAIIRRARQGPWELIDANTGAIVAQLPPYASFFCGNGAMVCAQQINNASQSPSGSLITRNTYTQTFWDARTGRLLFSIPYASRVDTSRYGDLIVADTRAPGAPRNVIRVYDGKTGREMRTFEGAGIVGTTSDEKRLFIREFKPESDTTEGDTYALLDAATGKTIRSYPGAQSVTFSSVGDRFAVRDVNKLATLYDSATGEQVAPLGNADAFSQRDKPYEPISGEGATADYGAGLDRFIQINEERFATLRRWSDGAVIAEIGHVAGSSFGYDFTGRRFSSTARDGVRTIRDMATAAPIAIIGRGDSLDYFEDRVLLTRNRDESVILELGDVASLRGTALRNHVCKNNRDWVGPFTARERDRKKGDAAARDIARRLRGRPLHVCDWRGLGSAEGWGQMFRYWGVRLGIADDYAPVEPPDQSPPAAAKKK